MAPATLNLLIAEFELALDCVAPIPNLYFIYLLITRQDLHNNLRFLLGTFSIMLILIALTRIPTQITYIQTGILYIDQYNNLVLGHEIGVMFFRTVIIPLTIERVIATLRSKSYEKENGVPWIGACSMLTTFIISATLGGYISFELNKSKLKNGVITFKGDFYALFQIIDVSLRLVICAICFSIFVALLVYNQKCYSFERMPNKHNLVQRYQFSENIRSSRQLLVIGTIIFICNLHFDFVMLRIFYDQKNFDIEFSQSFDFVMALALNVIPIAAIKFHPSMLRIFKSHLKILFLMFCPWLKPFISQGDALHTEIVENYLEAENTSTSATRKQSSEPRALLSGKKLIVNRDQQQRVYFDELCKSWSVKRALVVKSSPKRDHENRKIKIIEV